MCHFKTKIQSLQLSWVKRLSYSSNHKWKVVPRKYFACINLKTYFNSHHKLLNSEEIPKFYLDIHNLYMIFFKQKRETIKDINDQSLWLNWENKGINKRSDIIYNSGKLLSQNIISKQTFYKLFKLIKVSLNHG